MSSKYIINGGNLLKGTISIQGAKNAVTKQMVASLLTREIMTLKNVPNIGDVHATKKMMESLGSIFDWQGDTLTIDNSNVSSSTINECFKNINRLPILMVPGLIHLFKEASIPNMGGCPIGERPINFHIESFKKMGISCSIDEESYNFKATNIQGTHITLPFPSVGSTENLLMMATLAKGITVIKNAAVEPEITDLVIMLQSMGAIIHQETDRTWVIEGVTEMKGCTHKVIYDRIEAASFAVSAIATDGDITIKGADPLHLQSFLNIIRKVGGDYTVYPDGIRFFRKQKELQPVALETSVHPGFMTDWQQPLVILLTQAKGISIVHETVYENRFTYVKALNDMKAKIQLFNQCLGKTHCRFDNTHHLHSGVITGPTKLKGTKVDIPDLRAGFSYLVAAIIAEGTSELHNIAYIERGYNQIVEKFKQLGVTIKVEKV